MLLALVHCLLLFVVSCLLLLVDVLVAGCWLCFWLCFFRWWWWWGWPDSILSTMLAYCMVDGNLYQKYEYTGKPVRNYLKLSTQWFLQPPEAKTLLFRWIMDRFAGFQGGCLSRICHINMSDRSASWYGSYPSASAEVQISNSCY